MKTVHYPVMYREVIKELSLRNKKIIVDCTIGVASHALKFFEAMDKDSILIGIDKDDESLRVARMRLKKYESRFELFKDDFRNLDLILDNLGIKKADIFFFDLGISTFQLSDSQRGFSFSKDGPLDMRMDKMSFLCAYDIVNYLSEYELNAIFKKFGEERFSRRIARLVVEKRRQEPISTTSQLKDVVLEAVPRRHYSFRHPATRIFQALRIVVNRELESLEMGIKKAIEHLSYGGRIGVITFHSLEDRIVKHTFRDLSLKGVVKLVNKKPFVPGTEELKENISSRSAKLRVAEKII
ncbi:MAG: 16S rRNA (cytosine(1402)-N(4))-methyltransferase [Candidatus Omnitrophica bacterium 4484_171]|nr:MAG: 16S rRNA (cytosine(1402)-N(4))-methyltransferase [Candidatus Omnitrophica bacterium 4484_171]